ncbi:MAG: putative zinc-binding protein [Armatimonadetes bacterium]|nr:putative zinc-binding protein [Armatimonadota bacterium]
MSECCATQDVMLLACSGGSNVGQIANDAAKALDQLGQGRMYCAIGVGAQLPSFVDAAKSASVLVAIDGCAVACVKKGLEKAGIAPRVYRVVTELGIEKGHHFNYTREEVAKVAGATAAAIKGSGAGCCCAKR